VVDHAVAGLGHLVPGAGEVAERLGHDQPGLLGQVVARSSWIWCGP
jgi:hypothetical protein